MTTADPRVSQAVVVWTGFGRAPSPVRDDALVEQQFGELALDLMPLVRTLDDAFYESDARHVAVDDADMARRASADFRAVHPEVPEEAVEALAWCYTYDYR
jgi:hypothetical protein